MKTGTIVADSGNDAAVKAAAASDPFVGSLGAITAAALAAAVNKAFVVIDTKKRKVGVFDPVSGAFDPVNAALDIGLPVEDLVPDDETKRSTPWTRTGAPDLSAISDAIDAAIGAQKPSMPLSTLINRIEDALDQAGKAGVILINQVDETIKVHVGTPTEINDADPVNAVQLAFTFAKFTQTVEQASGPRDPFE